MKTIIVGMGNQGTKRWEIADKDVVGIVDPYKEYDYKKVEDVPLDIYDTALVCTPTHEKLHILNYLLKEGKNVLVEKPLISDLQYDLDIIKGYTALTTCYTAYNHRFEPHIIKLKNILDSNTLGKIYSCRMFYGNGTARDVKNSPWQDSGSGVLENLASHLIDLVLFLFGPDFKTFKIWSGRWNENKALDHIIIGSNINMMIELEATYLSWKNTFTIDVVGEYGSIKIDGLNKWGTSKFITQRRMFPSGVPTEDTLLSARDNTWQVEYNCFKYMCEVGRSNIDNDIWINNVIQGVSQC